MRVRARLRPATLYSHPGGRSATPRSLRPRPSTRMSRPPRRILLAPLVLALTTTVGGFCDDGMLVIVPEFEHTFSFESGLDGWVPVLLDGAVGGGMGDLEIASTVVSSGRRSARLHLSAPAAGSGIVAQHLFDVAPSQGYRIEMSYRIALADPPGAPSWRIMGGAGPEAVGADASGPALATLGDTGPAGADGLPLWESRTDTLHATSSDGGELWVAIGVVARSGGERSYYLDDVRLAFTREGGAGGR